VFSLSLNIFFPADVELKNNPVADKRLLKLIDQCKSKQILDYVKLHGAVSKAKASNEKGKSKNDKTKAKKSTDLANEDDDADDDDTDVINKHKIIVEKSNDETTLKVHYTEDVAIVRPYILCCIVKGILLDQEKLRKFLQMQTKLHDTVCEKREASTIATHDLKTVKGPVKYTAKLSKYLEIQPLGSVGKTTGQKLFDSLKDKADMLRKEKKRNVYSGIHKYDDF
jgi:hypothetical protein